MTAGSVSGSQQPRRSPWSWVGSSWTGENATIGLSAPPSAGSVAAVADSVSNAARTPGQAQPWAELGLKDGEYARIKEILGRRPTSSELAMYSVMWSEHCSYKSSKVHLRQFAELPP